MKIAVIPARGGSKRIPRKNIKPFAGLPIIAHSILAARESGVCDRVIVSTDDTEIAAVARDYGAETPFVRPPELADDHAGTMEVIQHAITWLDDNDCCPDYVCCLYPTAPFVTPNLLRRGLEILLQSGRQYAFPVTSFDFPIQRALRILADGSLDAAQPEYRFTRSQDLEPMFHDAGQFYWGRADAWKRGEVIYSPASVPIVVPRHMVQDIDTPEDWQHAERLHQAWRANTATEDQP